MQVFILAKSNSDTSKCGVIIIVSVTTTIVVLVMTLFEIFSQSWSLLKISSNSERNEQQIEFTYRSEQQIELTSDVRRRISGGLITITTSTITVETINPMNK